MTALLSTAKPIKRKCPICNKKRIERLFKKGARSCELCQIAKNNGVKVKIVIVKSLPSLKDSVQRLVNKYARLRDVNDGCISCTGKVEEGGHFWPMGSNSALRYNLDNINGQCTSCNRYKHGNLLEYRLKLVAKIGEKRVKYLDEHHHDKKKWSREELNELLIKYKELTK